MGAAAGIDFAAAFTEGGGAVAIVDPTLTVADTDDANLDGAIVQITNLQDAASEFLTFTCPSLPASCSGAIQVAEVTYDPGTGTLDINPAAPAPLADFEALLRSVGYNNTSATPSGTPRDITFTLDDGIATAIYVVSTMAVLAAVLINWRIPGLVLVALGATSNLVAIVANGGVMPTTLKAMATAGITPDGDFSNSAVLADPAVPFLTDIFAIPAAVPLANVFSIGDVLIGVGVAVAIALGMRGRPSD